MKDWVLSHTQLTPTHSTQVQFTHLCPSPEPWHPWVCWKSLICFLDSCHGTSHSTCPWCLGRRVFTRACWWLSIPCQRDRLLRVRKHIKVHNVDTQTQLCTGTVISIGSTTVVMMTQVYCSPSTESVLVHMSRCNPIHDLTWNCFSNKYFFRSSSCRSKTTSGSLSCTRMLGNFPTRGQHGVWRTLRKYTFFFSLRSHGHNSGSRPWGHYPRQRVMHTFWTLFRHGRSDW